MYVAIGFLLTVDLLNVVVLAYALSALRRLLMTRRVSAVCEDPQCGHDLTHHDGHSGLCQVLVSETASVRVAAQLPDGAALRSAWGEPVFDVRTVEVGRSPCPCVGFGGIAARGPWLDVSM